jgi:lipase chaperone LimK
MSGASIALRVVGVILAIVALAGVFFGIKWYTAEPSGRLNAREQIFDGSNIIAQYDWFHSNCGQIRATQQNLHNLKEQVKTLTGRAKQNMLTTIAGVQFQLTDKITEYEAKAGGEYTAGQFREAYLPKTIPTEVVVTCEPGQQ